VYGWDGSGPRLLKNVTSGTSFVDTGPTKLSSTLTLPSAAGDVLVDSTSNFNAGPNTIAFGASGPVSCTGIASSPTRFTGCTGGQPGEYPQDTPVRSGSRPRVTLSVALALDVTPADAKQRFVLLDYIVLRNSQPL
jgi:hypothetical protein